MVCEQISRPFLRSWRQIYRFSAGRATIGKRYLALKGVFMRHVRLFSLFVTALFTASLPAPASATTQNFVTIDRVGVQFTNLYVRFTTALTLSCNWGALYLDITTDKGKAILSVLLTARAAGIQLSRVDYAMDGSGLCTIDLVEI